MKADAIVVAYKSEDVIGTCVSSLRLDPSVGRIIVVNNSSGDLTEKEISNIDNVIYFEPASNIGFGSAVNYARDSVEEAFVALANPDTLQRRQTITDALGFLADHPRAGIVAPRMVDEANKIYTNSHHSGNLGRMLFERLGRPKALMVARSEKDHARAHLSNFVIGSFMVCRVAAMDAVDWFDESIFLFGEDHDLCRRVREAGWEVWFAPVGEVVHLSGHSWRQLDDEGRALFRAARYRELRRRGKAGAEIYKAGARVLDLFRRSKARER